MIIFAAPHYLLLLLLIPFFSSEWDFGFGTGVVVCADSETRLL